jgi:hypothetical protein
MASMVTFGQSNEVVAAVFIKHECGYCGSSIITGQRWVREKILAAITTEDVRYRRYHADLFGEEVLSCWEKHQLETDQTPATNRPA